MADPTLPDVVKAMLVPYNGTTLDTDKKITVQFNPTTLKVSLENELKADANSGGKRGTATQHIEKRSSSLSVELLFDTSLPEHEGQVEDVRRKTAQIAETFMKPKQGDEKAPVRLRLQWGTFAFDGLIATYAETIDFFSPEGVPLRATVALTIKEDQYQFAFTDVDPSKFGRKAPVFVGAPGEPVASSLTRAGQSPQDWRGAALASGIENPRLPGGIGVSVGGGIGISGGVGVSVSGGVAVSGGVGISGGVSFSVGASAALGTTIPGAFAAVGVRGGVGASASVSASASLGGGLSAAGSIPVTVTGRIG